MTSPNPRLPLNAADRWAQSARGIEPPEQLIEKTVDAMRAAAAKERLPRPATPDSKPPKPRRTSFVSRRGFVALGGACVLAAVAAGIPLALRDTSSSSDPSGAAPVFGLTIAQADEPGKAVAIEAADGYPLPMVGSDCFRRLSLLLNLSCVGDNIETLTFSLFDVPTDTFKGTRPFEPDEIVVGRVFFTKGSPNPFDTEALDAWWASHSTAPALYSEFTVDLRGEPNWNGVHQTEYGAVCNALFAVPHEDELWGQDPVMAAKDAWLRAEVTPREEGEDDELRQAYIDAYAQVSATPADAIAWARKCYIGSMALAAQNLSRTTLQVTATFVDGTTATKRYRIDTVENFEEAMGARYDALYELRSSEPDLSWPIAPFFSFVGEPHDPSEDPRLAVPLFTITDITDVARP